MLIRIAENNLTGVARKKNEYWENRRETPNEAFANDPAYRKMVYAYRKHNGLAVKTKWFEVRVIEEKVSCLVLNNYEKWYSDPLWMEAVFWVFQSPMSHYVDGIQYQYYVLEPFEVRRVWEENVRKYKKLPTRDPRTGIIIPVEACHLAWTETSGGYSDHLRFRPEPIKTQQEIDRENVRNETAAEIMKDARGLETRGDLHNLMKKAADQSKIVIA